MVSISIPLKPNALSPSIATTGRPVSRAPLPSVRGARMRLSSRMPGAALAVQCSTCYTAVPTIHQILLERTKPDSVTGSGPEPSGSKRAALRFIRSCSASLTQESAQALQAEFSAPVLCAFGMTEATHQVTTTDIGQDENPCA